MKTPGDIVRIYKIRIVIKFDKSYSAKDLRVTEV